MYEFKIVISLFVIGYLTMIGLCHLVIKLAEAIY